MNVNRKITNVWKWRFSTLSHVFKTIYLHIIQNNKSLSDCRKKIDAKSVWNAFYPNGFGKNYIIRVSICTICKCLLFSSILFRMLVWTALRISKTYLVRTIWRFCSFHRRFFTIYVLLISRPTLKIYRFFVHPSTFDSFLRFHTFFSIPKDKIDRFWWKLKSTLNHIYAFEVEITCDILNYLD